MNTCQASIKKSISFLCISIPIMGEGTTHHSGSWRTQQKGENQADKLASQIRNIYTSYGTYHGILLVRIVY